MQLQRQVNALQSDIGKRDDLTRQSIRVVNAQPPRPGQTCPNCKQVVGRPADAALPAAASSAALPPVPEGDVTGIAEDESSVFITECGGGGADLMDADDKPQWSSSINLDSKQRRPASAIVRPTSGVSIARHDVDSIQRPTSAIVTASPRDDAAGAVPITPTRPTSAKTPPSIQQSQRPTSAKPTTSRPASGMSQRTNSSATTLLSRPSAPSVVGARNSPPDDGSSSRSTVGPMGAHWDAMLRAGHTGSVDFSADSAAAVAKVKPKPASRTWGRENKARRGGLNDAVAQHGRQ